MVHESFSHPWWFQNTRWQGEKTPKNLYMLQQNLKGLVVVNSSSKRGAFFLSKGPFKLFLLSLFYFLLLEVSLDIQFFCKWLQNCRNCDGLEKVLWHISCKGPFSDCPTIIAWFLRSKVYSCTSKALTRKETKPGGALGSNVIIASGGNSKTCLIF